MTTWYLDSVSGSDSNGGTATNDALASFSQLVTAGYTGGDIAYVKGGGATYAGYGFQGMNLGNKMITLTGYGVTPGDNCSTGVQPPIVHATDESEALRPCAGMNVENFSIKSNIDTVWSGVLNIYNNGSHTRNVTVHVESTASGGQRSNILNGAGYRSIYGIRMFMDPGCEVYNSACWSSSGISRVPMFGCVFDFRNLSFSQTSGVGMIANYNSTNHGGVRLEGSFMIGNPDETHTGIYHRYDTHTSALMIKNNVFYNLDIGLDLDTSLADSASLLSTFDQKTTIEKNFFVNCRIGILGADGIDFPYKIKDNVFYNCTTAQTSGSFSNVHNNITATQNPIDLENYVLNSYGESLLHGMYQDGFDTVESSPVRKGVYDTPIKTKFRLTSSGNLSLGTADVGDTVTVSGRSFQKISSNPIVWRRV